MPDTPRTIPQLQTIFADGQPAGSITPQDMRDFVVSVEAFDTALATEITDLADQVALSGAVIPPGGSMGQALIKASGTDYDADWGSVAPGAHAASHADGGSDEITIAQSQVTDLTTDLAAKASTTAVSPAFVTLTDAATVTWATAGARVSHARVTLGGNRTIDVTGAVDGAQGVLIVIQDGTGSRTLTLPGLEEGGGLTLSTAASSRDVLAWIYDGTSFHWTIGKGFA